MDRLDSVNSSAVRTHYLKHFDSNMRSVARGGAVRRSFEISKSKYLQMDFLAYVNDFEHFFV